MCNNGRGNDRGNTKGQEAMAGRKVVTSRDVAREAGVSRSAVSRAFTEGASVSERTRQRVLAAAWKLGYSPNALARGLITQRSNMVGLVMADITNPFYAKVLESFSEKLQSVGQRVLLFSIAKVHDIDQALPALLQYQVDGVIITSAVLSSAMAETCAKTGKPVILFNRYVRETTTSAVCTDNVAAGRRVADLLLDAGHRRCAFIAGTANTSTSNDRQRGFLDRLAARGAPPPLVDRGDYRYGGGFAAAERLFTRDDPPDAVFCANDVMAMGAMDLIRRVRGLRVPDDVSVIGFDGIAASGWPSFDLTTMEQQVERMTDEAMEILMARIADPALPPETRFVPARLVARTSARLPREALAAAS